MNVAETQAANDRRHDAEVALRIVTEDAERFRHAAAGAWGTVRNAASSPAEVTTARAVLQRVETTDCQWLTSRTRAAENTDPAPSDQHVQRAAAAIAALKRYAETGLN